MKDEITDCGGDGCDECDVCKRLNFLDWCSQVGCDYPVEIEENRAVDAYIKEKYGV